MFPAPVVNRIPPGLLRVMGLNETGRNPDSLSNVLIGNLELMQLYLAASATYEASTTNNVTGDGTNTANFGVQQTEYWWLHAATINLVGAASTSFTATGRIQILGVGGLFVNLAVTDQLSVTTAAQTFSSAFKLNGYGLILPPGTRLSAQISSYTGAGTGSIGWNAVYTRLPI
jgi:hypothetical protein